MIPERTVGVVLRTRPLTETSLIVNWLTPDLGRIATVAKGARRPKSPFRGQVDLFYVVDISFARSARSDLHTLREAKLLEPHSALRLDLDCLQQAAYCAKLIEQATETETPLPGLFESFGKLLNELPKQPAQPHVVLAFEMKLLEYLGLQPDLEQTHLSAGSRQLVNRFLELDWPPLFRLKLSDPQVVEISQFLHGFLIYHLERIPKGRTEALRGAP